MMFCSGELRGESRAQDDECCSLPMRAMTWCWMKGDILLSFHGRHEEACMRFVFSNEARLENPKIYGFITSEL
jgi:hypothetical protein